MHEAKAFLLGRAGELVGLHCMQALQVYDGRSADAEELPRIEPISEIFQILGEQVGVSSRAMDACSLPHGLYSFDLLDPQKEDAVSIADQHTFQITLARSRLRTPGMGECLFTLGKRAQQSQVLAPKIGWILMAQVRFGSIQDSIKALSIEWLEQAIECPSPIWQEHRHVLRSSEKQGGLLVYCAEIEAGDVWQLQVKEYQVWNKLPDRTSSTPSALKLTHDFESTVRPQQSLEMGSRQRFAIDDDSSDRVHHYLSVLRQRTHRVSKAGPTPNCVVTTKD